LSTVLVTGANAGIGRAAALALADMGWTVLAACRNEEKAARTAEELRAASGNGEVTPVVVELGDLASVKECADRLLSDGRPLDVLLNNAGVGGQRGQTRDGFELAFGVNHVGPFLLTTSVLPLLEKSPAARVVTVASDEHKRASGIDWEAVRRPTRSFTGLPEYAVSKLANVLFSAELGRRCDGSGVTTYSVHPGAVATDIYRRVPAPLRAVIKLAMRSPEKGADTSVWCSTSGDVAGRTGRYYQDRKETEPSKAVTPELAAELWQRSEEWTAAFR